MRVSNPDTDFLVRLMDVATRRHEVVANNIANINTPGYRNLEVQFEDLLAERTQTGRAGDVPIRIVQGDGPSRVDGNNVDMDREMGRLQKNALLFRMYSQVLAMQLAQMRSAISGR